MMRSRGWLKDFLSHFILILLFAAGLFFVWRTVARNEDLLSLTWLRWLLYFSAGVLAVLFIVFINGLLANYYLERFDPAKPDSLKRLEKIRRFQLGQPEREKLLAWQEPLRQTAAILTKLGFSESARWRHGIIYTKNRRIKRDGQHLVDQYFICYKPILNVLIVDGVLRDCMFTITKMKHKRPASRNYILFITDSQDRSEVTSSAAGIVNFLGKIEEGSLGPMLLDTGFGRLFFPLDRSLIPFHHRRLQDAIRRFLRKQIIAERPLNRGERFTEPESAEPSGVRKAQLNLSGTAQLPAVDDRES